MYWWMDLTSPLMLSRLSYRVVVDIDFLASIALATVAGVAVTSTH